MARFENNSAHASGSFAWRRGEIKQENEPHEDYFTVKTAAQRFAKGRPHFHSFVIGKIKGFPAPENRFESVLDVGCGTGLSIAALKEIAETMVEIDVSSKMIDHASKTDGIECVWLQPGISRSAQTDSI